MHWDLVLERKSRNRLNEESTRKKLRELKSVVEENEDFHFHTQMGKLHDPKKMVDAKTNAEVWRYLVKMRLRNTGCSDEGRAQSQFEYILAKVNTRARQQGWNILGKSETPVVDNAAEQDESLSEAVRPPRTPFIVPELTDEVKKEFFSGIYDRDGIIRRIHDATSNYFDTLEKNKANPKVEVARSHILLKGKPAGCKTTLYERFKLWYEKDAKTERILFIDAHSMTKAGLENVLLDQAEAGTLPEIIVLEEIDKQETSNLLALTSVMGSGYISKLNARIGHRRALANVLVWATCNDESVIQNFKNGFLWSRFVHRPHCVRPNRDQMHRILCDKVKLMGGNLAWVDKVIDFAYDTMTIEFGRPMDDPREIRGLLDGRDRLLDGSYQRDVLDNFKAEEEERKADLALESK